MLKKGGASAAGFWSGAFLAEAPPHLFPYSDCYEKIFAAGFADDLLRCGFPAFAQDGPMCNRTCTPAEWQSLSVQERADLWPVMTQENRRHIWMLMDDAEKRALREKLRPISREEFRRHFECSIDPKGLGAMEPGDPRPVMSPMERMHMRNQIIQVHQEFMHVRSARENARLDGGR